MPKIYKITGYHDFRDYLKNKFNLADEKYWTIFQEVYDLYRSCKLNFYKLVRMHGDIGFYDWINSLEEDELKTIIILSELQR
jgi:hypothetical protein